MLQCNKKKNTLNCIVPSKRFYFSFLLQTGGWVGGVRMRQCNSAILVSDSAPNRTDTRLNSSNGGYRKCKNKNHT